MRTDRLPSFLHRHAHGLLAGAWLMGLGCAGPMPDQGTTAPVAPAPSDPVVDEAAPAPEVALTAAPAAAPAPAPAAKHVVLDHETLRLEGTPAVPDAVRQRIERYLETRSAELGDLRDDGGAVLMTTRFGDTAQVHHVRAPMGARTQLTFLSEPAGWPRFVPGAASSVIYTADAGGNEQYQIWRLDLDTGNQTRLTDPSARNTSPVWSRDGKRLAYASNARNKRDFDIWVGDGKDAGSAARVLDVTGSWAPLDWSPDDKKLLLGEYISATESAVHLLDVASRTLTRVSPPGPVAHEEAHFGQDGKTIYVTSDREGEFKELYETDLEGKSWRSLTRDVPWDVEGVALAPDGRTLAFTVNQDGYSSLHLLDTRTRKHRPVPELPRGIIAGLRFARRAPVLGFTMATAVSTGDVYTYDLRRRGVTRWTESEMGGLPKGRLSEPELVRYKSFDGREIPAFYFKPAGAGPFPVLVSIHGGPEAQARPNFSSPIQYLVNESRIAVLVPNVRGSSGYGKTYLNLDNGALREDSVKDIGALLDWIATRPELDARRVGVFGGSYGGYMVLASLVHFGNRITAGTDIVGISNFVTFLESTAEYRRDLRRVEYGDERDPQMRAHLEKISPLRRAGEIRSALFVAQGANDPRVPASEAAQIVAAVRGAGQDVWYMLA
ncbi:MAG TPA: prolyl oligopeptidase family serine peptidase, partial [Haliangium sp.]|nr:prolyl oligopeptidase family serine peptidase [Haliangium sp.]